MTRFIPLGMGWQPEIYDPRDYTLEAGDIPSLTRELTRTDEFAIPDEVELREFFPDVEDQGPLSASCAFAVLGLIEYFNSRHVEPTLGGSRLFLYQMSLRMRGTHDDLGSDFRTTLKAVRRFGVPLERHWPYEPTRFQQFPTDPFLFAFADDYRHIQFVRVDTRTRSHAANSDRNPRTQTLTILKTALACQIPFLLGFLIPSTMSWDGLVYGLDRARTLQGGQAVMVIGYDDGIRIASHKGALLIRNSWGSAWGDQGHGWLPYDLLGTPAVGDAWLLASPQWGNAALDHA